MKSPLVRLVPFALYAFACARVFAALPIAETFDQKPAASLWSLSTQAKVLDGELVLAAAGPADGYPTTGITTKAGDPALNFLVKPIEIELSGIDVSGADVPANSVFMAIITSDFPNEMKARSYLKLRLSGDGTLLLNCAEIGGDRTRETTLQTLKVKLPVRRLTLQISSNGFVLKGVDASRPFEQSAGWNERLDLTAWKGAAPFVIIKGVRRPGEGEAMVRLGEVTIREAK
ncbi:MAG: hypothetical protein WC205_11015 [Opitutaceae bacterium]|jgi:hypothetical protein